MAEAPQENNESNQKRNIAAPFAGWRLCSHCEGHGTCHSGKEGASCFVCAKDAGVPKLDIAHFGLPCSICNGHGCGAPSEVKANRLMGAWVTVSFSVGIFVVVVLSGFFFREQLDKVLTFAGTIIGSISGFYFGGRDQTVKSNG